MPRFDVLATLPSEADGPLVLAALVNAGFTVGTEGRALYTRGQGASPVVLMALVCLRSAIPTNVLNETIRRIAQSVTVLSIAIRDPEGTWALGGPSYGVPKDLTMGEQRETGRGARAREKEKEEPLQIGGVYDQVGKLT